MDSKRHNNATSNNSITYQLFMHLEELRRPTPKPLLLRKSKVNLTTRLISDSVRNIQQCNTNDLKVINREIIFKEKLRKQIESMKFVTKQQAAGGESSPRKAEMRHRA